MKVKPYDREHALALLAPSSLVNEWEVDERGLWPLERHEHLWKWGMQAEYEVTAWKPAVAYADASNAPDLVNTPALPFPFDGKDLAAFLLAGQGLFVADFYGAWESGPDADALARIAPGNNYARRAVVEAFEAYRVAAGRVGRLDLGNENLDAWQHWVLAMATELLKSENWVAGSVVPLPSIDQTAQRNDRRYRRKGWRDTPVFDYVVSQYKTIMPAPFKNLLKLLESAQSDAPILKTRGGFVMTDSGKQLTAKTLATDFKYVKQAALTR